MGIFSRKCEKCGNSVKKRAKFCGKCGDPAPKSWIKCGKCNKYVGAESEFCPHCKNPMYVSERESVAGNKLTREKDVFLQRIEVDSIKNRIKNELIIEHGTCAVFMSNGKVKDVLHAGTHSIKDGLLRKVFLGERDKSFFIIDNAEIVLKFERKNLRSKDDMSLNFYTEAIFSFNEKYGQNLIANLLKEKRTLIYADIADAIDREIDRVLVNLANSTVIDDLVKNPDAIINFEDVLAEELSVAGESYGLKVVRVAAAEFYGKDYEQIREKSGESEKIAKTAVIQQRTRELLSKDKMHEFKTEQDLNLYMEQMSHEYGINQANMQQEIDLLKQVQNNELNENEALQKMKIEQTQLDHSQTIDTQQRAHERVEHKKDSDAEMEETEKWIDVRSKKEAAKRNDMNERLKIYANYSPAQLAAELATEQVEQILKARQLEMQDNMQQNMAKMTPEQILAMNVANNPEAAKALAEIAKAKNNVAEEKLTMAKENNEKLEKMMNKTIDANAKVATAKAGVGDIKIIK